jgi:radical SAM-linked protein
MQRLRIRFSRGEEIKYISHLDLLRLWQRALNRAEIPLAYSEGFSPHPRMSLAAPLALGVTGEAELMDIFLARWSSPHTFTTAMARQLPPGIKIEQVFNIAPTMPSLQSQVRSAEFKVGIETDKEQAEIESAINTLLDKESIPWQHQRDTGIRRYDLRPLIEDLWLAEWRQGYVTIMMRLRCDSSGSGRPEQMTAALGFAQYPDAINRTQLILQTQ